jgi:stage II sporulation protein GA (sporulation sigma-E factor processing peptidase)
MTVVYIDKVFVLNLALDYLLLLTTARFAGMPLQRLRVLLAAAMGAVYAVSVFSPGCTLLAHPLLRLLSGVLMSLFAYWPLQRRWRITGLFLLISAALAGVVLAAGLALGSGTAVLGKLYYAQISWPLLLGTACSMYVLLHLIFRQGGRHVGGELMRINIGIYGKEREVLALHDTGNTLRDPVRGQPVLVMEQSVLQDTWDKRTADILKEPLPAEEKIARLHYAGVGEGFTLLPFRSVGTASGLLLAVRSEWIRVGRAVYSHAWIALTDGPVNDGGPYQALWGGVKRGEEYVEIDQPSTYLDPQTLQAG